MSRALKWAAVLATIAALATVFAPAFLSVSYPQALTNLIVGEFAALSVGYTAYRIAYGKRPSRSVALATVVLGAILAVSPLVFGLVQSFTSVNMVGGGLVALVGLASLVTTFTDGDDRNVRNLSAGREAGDDGAKAA